MNTDVDDSVIVNADSSVVEVARDPMSMEINNPRISRVRALEDEARSLRAAEQERANRIRVEQEYVSSMIASVNENIERTRQERQLNEEFEKKIRSEVYQMHGLNDDKLQGMEERENALYLGATFSLFFLSIVMIILCGLMHGFADEITIFMAYYTAVEASLLSGVGRNRGVTGLVLRILYLMLFPAMLTAFVCYEQGFSLYDKGMPFLVIGGMVVLALGSVSFFIYDPYKQEGKNLAKADRYIKEMEKTALKDVRMREKAFRRQEEQRQKEEDKSREREEREALKARVREEKEAERARIQDERNDERKQRAGEREELLKKWKEKLTAPFMKKEQEVVPIEEQIAAREAAYGSAAETVNGQDHVPEAEDSSDENGKSAVHQESSELTASAPKDSTETSPDPGNSAETAADPGNSAETGADQGDNTETAADQENNTESAPDKDNDTEVTDAGNSDDAEKDLGSIGRPRSSAIDFLGAMNYNK